MVSTVLSRMVVGMPYRVHTPSPLPAPEFRRAVSNRTPAVNFLRWMLQARLMVLHLTVVPRQVLLTPRRFAQVVVSPQYRSRPALVYWEVSFSSSAGPFGSAGSFRQIVAPTSALGRWMARGVLAPRAISFVMLIFLPLSRCRPRTLSRFNPISGKAPTR